MKLKNTVIPIIMGVSILCVGCSDSNADKNLSATEKTKEAEKESEAQNLTFSKVEDVCFEDVFDGSFTLIHTRLAVSDAEMEKDGYTYSWFKHLKFVKGDVKEPTDVTLKFADGAVNVDWINDSETLIISCGGTITSREPMFLFAGMCFLEDISFDNFTISNEAISLAHMFEGCSSLKSVDLSGLGLEKLNVDSVNEMFKDCQKLTSIDLTPLSSCDLKYVNDMFNGCTGLKSLDVSPLNVTNVKDADNMFAKCTSLTSLIGNVGFKNNEVFKTDSSVFKDCKVSDFTNFVEE